MTRRKEGTREISEKDGPSEKEDVGEGSPWITGAGRVPVRGRCESVVGQGEGGRGKRVPF